MFTAALSKQLQYGCLLYSSTMHAQVHLGKLEVVPMLELLNLVRKLYCVVKYYSTLVSSPLSLIPVTVISLQKGCGTHFKRNSRNEFHC